MTSWAPINTDPSTEKELSQTLHLRQYLEQQGLYEDQAEAHLRELLLGTLDRLVKDWVKGVARQCGMSEASAQEANAKIFTFGSYRLGVHAPGADIDVLCVAPQFAKRDLHFFGQEQYCLETVLMNTPGVTEVVAVPRAYVPVLKVKFRGIELDMLFVSLGQFLVPEDLDLQPNSVLRGCDEASVRSINGCRVTDTILRAVPDVPTFRLALKAIKLWADRRGVYSNVLGYLGGVNMALLVARVCRWYPACKAASTIIHRFFLMFSCSWQWPLELHLVPQKHDTLGLAEWDPINNDRDRTCLMPIITPCYPAMNSTYNVTRGTFDVMMSEFARGLEVCTQILVKEQHTLTPWERLCEEYQFFQVKAGHYVQIEVCAENALDLERWSGWVESRIRLLVRQLEEHVCVRPYPKAKTLPADSTPGDPRPRKAYFLCVTRRPTQAVQVNAATGAVITAQTYTLQRGASAVGAANTNSVNITQPVVQFRNQVLAWTERRPGMELIPRVAKARDLPGWLFASGVNPLAPAPSPAPSLAAPADALKQQPAPTASAASAATSGPGSTASVAASRPTASASNGPPPASQPASQQGPEATQQGRPGAPPPAKGAAGQLGARAASSEAAASQAKRARTDASAASTATPAALPTAISATAASAGEGQPDQAGADSAAAPGVKAEAEGGSARAALAGPPGRPASHPSAQRPGLAATQAAGSTGADVAAKPLLTRPAVPAKKPAGLVFKLDPPKAS